MINLTIDCNPVTRSSLECGDKLPHKLINQWMLMQLRNRTESQASNRMMLCNQDGDTNHNIKNVQAILSSDR